MDAERQKQRLVRVVVGAVLAIALFCAVQRLRSGVDLEDEATYIAIPYRFALGDRPFVDEINPIQTAGFITRPLIELYTSVAGTEGIVLFTRYAYLCVCLGVAWIAFAFARRYVEAPLALLVVAPIVVHMPGLANLSYHTIASLGFTGGVFALAHGLSRENGRTWSFFGGALHALAAVALQVYLAAAFFAVVGLFFGFAPRKNVRALLPYAVGFIATALVFLPYFLDFGDETLSYVLSHTTRDMPPLTKAHWVYMNQLRMIPHKLVCAGVLVVLIVSARLRWSIPALVALFALPYLAYVERGERGANCNTTLLVLTAPFLWLALRERGEATRWLFAIWLPSFAASVVLAWASSVHVLAEGYAQVPALIVTALLAARITAENAPRIAPWPALAWSTLVVVSFLGHLRFPYNDDPSANLNTRLTTGPWRGIATTREKADHVELMQASIAAFEDPAKRILFLNHFPAGYLMTRMRPAADSVWAITCRGEWDWNVCADVLERDLHRYGGKGIVVFDMQRTFHTRGWSAQIIPGPVQRVLEQCLERVLVTPEFTVYFAP
ncbi:MAG: hypothetical protein SGI72_12845 [Planctomycetota bacterium]|nr:hypothetical protein [Planctomycetota bacterium]